MLDAALGAARRLLARWDVVVAALVVFEVLANAAIIARVRYTEIDWRAYMDEVRPVMEEGERNYTLLRGETGPLVYPAGFVWLFGALRGVVGEAVPPNQYVFAGIYIAFFLLAAVVYRLAGAKGLHPLVLVPLCLSKRVHSLFALRLFNDGPTMLILWAAILAFAHRKHLLGCTLFSLALATKMNALLVLPAVLLVLVVHKGPLLAIPYLVYCGAFQYAIAYPFLQFDAAAYLGAAFNFSRVFKQKWSVNFKWVPCEPLAPGDETLLVDCRGIFTSKEFGLGLIALQLTILSIFAWRWVRWAGGPVALLTGACRAYTPRQIVLIFLTVNLVGVACGRSLHFQFYVWYFHSLPLLVSFITRLPLVGKALLLFLVELCWNPWTGESSTVESSLLLTACHVCLLAGLWWETSAVDEVVEKAKQA